MLFSNLPKHNCVLSPLTSHATVYTVDLAGSQANVVSALQVFRTQLDGGATELFAVGRFHDTVRLSAAQPKLVRRVVKLDTRVLGYGHPIPFLRMRMQVNTRNRGFEFDARAPQPALYPGPRAGIGL